LSREKAVSVTVNGPGTITGQFDYTGPDGSVITFYGWTFPVTVDGQAGVYTVWIDSNDPSAESGAAADAVQDLEADPGSMGGIADGSDPGAGDFGGDSGDPGGDQGDFGGDDGGDGAVADGGGGAVSGESV
jgi:hypothetical protein